MAQTKAERDANLDKLETATKIWFTKEQTRLDNETKFLKAVQQGRGVGELASDNFESASLGVIDEINAFLLLD